MYSPMNTYTSRIPKLKVNILDKRVMYNSLNMRLKLFLFFSFLLVL